jgi:hypothetical protein
VYVSTPLFLAFQPDKPQSLSPIISARPWGGVLYLQMLIRDPTHRQICPAAIPPQCVSFWHRLLIYPELRRGVEACNNHQTNSPRRPRSSWRSQPRIPRPGGSIQPIQERSYAIWAKGATGREGESGTIDAVACAFFCDERRVFMQPWSYRVSVLVSFINLFIFCLFFSRTPCIRVRAGLGVWFGADKPRLLPFSYLHDHDIS